MSRAVATTISGARLARRTKCRRTPRVVDVDISAREYHAESPETDELRTPYLANDQLDLSAWARDALVLELPDKILCRIDCAGLCPVCGRDLNVDQHGHDDEELDSRWAALSELRDKL